MPRDYEMALPPGTDVVGLFAERVADYRATVHRTDAAGLAGTVAGVLAAWGARTTWSRTGSPRLAGGGAGVVVVRDDPPLSKAQLDAVDAVITGAAVGIAGAGTIVIDARSARAAGPQPAPDRHLCIVEVGRIVGTVPEALARLDPRRPLTWISGPSATSDIE